MQLMLKYCMGLPEVSFDPGSILIAEGERRDHLYVLVEGRVEVLRGDVTVTTEDEPGATFGEMAALLDIPHTATVRAASRVRAYRIENGEQFLERWPKIAIQLAKLFARRLYDTTTGLVEAKN